MAMKEAFSEESQSTTVKKPYEKPSFRHEQVFVTTALQCGKIGNISQSCSSTPKAS